MLYTMTFTDHREKVAVMEFEAASDAEAPKVARHHMRTIRAIFRRDHPRLRLDPGWYVLYLVRDSAGRTVYARPRN